MFPTGSTNNTRWKEVITTINNEANRTRLKIPVLYGIDAVHGASYTAGATLFLSKLEWQLLY
jgi:beta-glucosidase